jgi:two-component system cell cycle response regulator
MSRILVVSASIERACRIERLLLEHRSKPGHGFGPPRDAMGTSAAVAISTTEPDALGMACNGHCELVLVDAADPVGDPFALCRALKPLPISVVVLTDPNLPWQGLLALDAGADELASKEAPDFELLHRLRSVAALKGLVDEYSRTAALLGLPPEPNDRAAPATILLADPDLRSRERLSLILSAEFRIDPVSDPDLAFRQAATLSYDVAIVSRDWSDRDGQLVARQIRGLDRRRSLCVIALGDRSDDGDEAADDMIARPVDRCEAILRVRVMARRRRLSCLCRGDDGGPFLWAAPRAIFPDFRHPPDRFAA